MDRSWLFSALTAVFALAPPLAVAGPARSDTVPWHLWENQVFGTRQYGVGVVEIAGSVGFAGGQPLIGVHYAERGSMLAQTLFGAADAAGAGARASTTGKDQTYVINRDPDSSFGVEFDYLTGPDEAGHLNADLFGSIPYGDDALPVILDIGLNVNATSTGMASYDDKCLNKQNGFGLFCGVLVPVTPRAHVEGALRLQLGHAEGEDQFWSAELGGLFNLSNRVFGRLRANYNGALTTYLNVGVRL
jgi:hypothetical protein